MSNKKSIYEKIAELSASKSPDGEWWGHDTSIGDLPKRIKEVLEKEIYKPFDVWKPFCYGEYQGVGDESCWKCPLSPNCEKKSEARRKMIEKRKK